MRIRFQRAQRRGQRWRAPQSRHLIRDEAGVIAIIVALSISTFLLGFAALAVDLGTAYVRKAELKSLAEKVAIAGATGLPAISDGIAAAVNTLGRGASGGTPGTGLCADLDLPGVCTAPANWASDGNDANGEITFYADEGQEGELADQNGDGVLSTADQVVGGSGDAVGIHVLLPPSQVPFGFAGALGFDSASFQQTATARIGTPLGSGILPFSLSPVDLTNGQFCAQDPAALPGPDNTVPPPTTLIVIQVPPGKIPVEGQQIQVTFQPNFFVQNTIRVFFDRGDTPAAGVPVIRSGGSWTVTVPAGDPGTSIKIWAKGTIGFGAFSFPFTSVWNSLTYEGTAPSGISPCTLPQANRGFTKIARSDPGDTLEANIRSGPQVKLYPTGGLVNTVGTALGCVSTTLSSPVTTCLASDLSNGFADRMTKGFFTSDDGKDGRLIGQCGGGTMSTHGHTLDDTPLLNGGSPLVDTSFGSEGQLRNSILSGTDPSGKKGWIRSQAFRCPRLAVMPVLDPNPLTTVIGGQNITRLMYVWIDDDGSGRGLAWSGSTLRSFRGYVIDPKYLPETVAGSPVVGPYLGPDMPKEAMLIPDLSSP